MNEHQALAELDIALEWYNTNSRRARIAYLALRTMTLTMAAAIPVLAVLDGPSWLMAVLGSAIVLTEGISEIFQLHNRWLGWRTAWHSLHRERRLYQNLAGPYEGISDPDRLLLERMDEAIEAENAKWAVDTAALSKTTVKP